jgi:signal transduction histidine kinase
MTKSRAAAWLLGVSALVAAYYLTLRSSAPKSALEVSFQTIIPHSTPTRSSVHRWIYYVLWLPCGIALLRAVRPSMPSRPVLRSLLIALTFAPGVLGFYVGWLVPAFVAVVFQLPPVWHQPSARALAWVAATSGVPFLISWALSWCYLMIRLERAEERRTR